MDNYTFTNNAKEEFKIFLDEENRFCLNIRFEGELIACFILGEKDLNDIVKWKKLADDYRRE